LLLDFYYVVILNGVVDDGSMQDQIPELHVPVAIHKKLNAKDDRAMNRFSVGNRTTRDWVLTIHPLGLI
jgi:hypothetical protein